MFWLLLCFVAGWRRWPKIVLPLTLFVGVALSQFRTYERPDLSEDLLVGAILLPFGFAVYFVGAFIPHYRAARRRRLSSATGPSVDRASGQR